jgi:hypothetical protein
VVPATLWGVIALVVAAIAQQPDVRAIVARSAEATEADWSAAPRYDFAETDRAPHGGTVTYEVTMIRGTPYSRRVAENGKPLPAEEAQKEEQKLQKTIARRRAESPGEAARRIDKYQRAQDRDHLLMTQMTKAFDFHLLGQQTLGDRAVWVLNATPRASYRPPNMEAEALTGMTGTLWIDTATYQWVRVEAHVIRPVSIGGFLARVNPGTFFKLERTPVAPGIWLTQHFVMRSSADVLWLFKRRDAMDETFSDYQLARASAIE